ncbi:MAG: DMT family transporter, partial [Proteobacteria bacterium]|nr:DMT family transporter [Pseudomonadota bacterium]
MLPVPPAPLRAAALMIVASALIAVTMLLAKILGAGVDGPGLHPLQVSAGRFFFGFCALSVVAVRLRPAFAGAVWKVHAARSLSGWLGVSCMFAAAARMPLAEATAISFLSPLAAMLLAIFFLRERVGPVRWTAAAISVVGAMILIRPGTETFQPAALIALSAALLMGIETILIKRLTSNEPPMRILLINNAIGGMIAVSAASFVWTWPSPAEWALLVLLGATMVTAQGCFIQSMRRADASYVIPFVYATLI